jgi:hypothetical protein
MSWRDETPEPVQDDLDLLADQALSAAAHLLEKNGEFYPFAISLDNEGAPEMAAADPGEGEHPSSQAVLDLLYERAASGRGDHRGAAFAAPVEMFDGDAVRVEIEHRDGGPALVLFLPDQRRKLRKSVEFGDVTAGTGKRRVWV